MTMDYDDGLDLGLNLVFDAPAAPRGGGVGGGGGVGKKRKTKYDRRRERGRLAKLAREDDDGGGWDRAGVVGGAASTARDADSASGADSPPPPPPPPSSSPAVVAAPQLGGGGGLEPSSEADGAATPAPPPPSDEKIDEDPCGVGGGSAPPSGGGDAAPDDAGQQRHRRHQQQAETSTSSSATAEDRAAAAAATTSSSSRRRRDRVSLDDGQRAAYLAEFHARPRDLDRNEGASGGIKLSVASRHIFGDGGGGEANGGGGGGGGGNDDRRDRGFRDDGREGNDEKKRGGAAAAAAARGGDAGSPFSRLGLHPRLVSALTSPSGPFKLDRPTVVQSRCIAALLPRGGDRGDRDDGDRRRGRAGGGGGNLFVQSETGSGKTLAYLLPIVQCLASADADRRSSYSYSSSSPGAGAGAGAGADVDRKSGGTRCVLLCPTRELATQTHSFADRLCRASFPWIVPGCLSGGEKRKSEKARLRKGITLLVATPGRLLDHLTKTESLSLSLKRNRGLEWLVLDEADRLLDGGGLGGQVEQIVQRLRGCCGSGTTAAAFRSVLVSATVTSELEGIARRVLGGDGDGGGWTWARGHDDNATGKGGGGVVATRTTATKELGVSPDHDDDDDVDNDDNDDDDDLPPPSSKEHASDDGADNDSGNVNTHELDNAAPRQLAQLYMIVSAKLRLSTLVAFLASRAANGERTVVFLSTCDNVDYHHALFSSMESVLRRGEGKGDDGRDDNDDDDDDDNGSGKRGAVGIFGRACPIYKLHGDIPHHKRVSTLRAFSDGKHRSGILLATDVAARGLNFPSLDWIVQYDPPCETRDYVHRAGRSARAGQAGHAILFLLPSEKQYIEVLELRGLREISPLSLSSTLSAAATLCAGVTREGESGGSSGGNNGFSDGGAEAFTFAVQNRLEECVLQDDVSYRASIEKMSKGGDPKLRRKQRRRDGAVVGPLLEGARRAFLAFLRAYPAKEKAVRHIFNARALHLGHIARSLALRETPKMVSMGNSHSSGNAAVDGGEGGRRTASRDKAQSGDGKGEKRKSRLAFGDAPAEETDDGDAAIENSEQERYLSLLGDAIGGGASRSSGSTRSTPNKKIKQGGRGGQDVQKRMMEAAMLIQSQEYM
jgi:ATP-dependent RNA helicase DDX31/DBP7